MKYPQKRNIILRTIKEYKDLFKNSRIQRKIFTILKEFKMIKINR